MVQAAIGYLGGSRQARLELFKQWAVEDPAAALAEAVRLGEDGEREESVCAVLERWAASDLDAALAAWEKVPDLNSRWSLRKALADGAACTQPARVFQLLATADNPDRHGNSFVTLFRCWTDRDPAAAAAAAKSLKTSAWRAEACCSVAFALAASRPQAALDWALALEDNEERQAACTAVFAAVSDPGADSILELFNRITNRDLRRKLTPTIAEKLGWRDPAGAAQWADSLPAGVSRTRALETVMKEWTRQDPRSAAAFALERVSEEPHEASASPALAALAGHDPVAAAEMLREVTEPGIRQRLLTGLIRGLSYSDDKDQSELIVQLASGLPESERVKALSVAIYSLGNKHPDSARRVLELIPPGEARIRAVAGLSSDLAGEDPQAGLELALTLPDSELRDRTLASVIGSMARTNLGKAVELLRQLPPGGHRTQALRGMADAWTSESPGEVFEFMRHLPANELSQELMLSLGSKLARISPEEAQTRAAELPTGGAREGFLQGVCSAIAMESPEQAARIVSEMPPGHSQAVAALNVAGCWAAKDPLAATAWVEAFPAGETRAKAISTVAHHLACEDPAAAGAWARRLSGTERDGAHAALAGVLAFEQPSEAAAWAMKIQDPACREQSIREVTARWGRYDRPAADRWLQQLGYAEEQRQRLLGLSPFDVSCFMQSRMYGHWE